MSCHEAGTVLNTVAMSMSQKNGFIASRSLHLVKKKKIVSRACSAMMKAQDNMMETRKVLLKRFYLSK